MSVEEGREKTANGPRQIWRRRVAIGCAALGALASFSGAAFTFFRTRNNLLHLLGPSPLVDAVENVIWVYVGVAVVFAAAMMLIARYFHPESRERLQTPQSAR